MINKEVLIKQIVYRSTHRGTKEMDLLLGNFVKQYVNQLKEGDLEDLKKILSLDDEIIQKWYFEKKSNNPILNTKLSNMIIKFKI